MSIVPFQTDASFLSIFGFKLNGVAETAMAAEDFDTNSQTVPVLTATTGPESLGKTDSPDITIVDGSALVAQTSLLGSGADAYDDLSDGRISTYVIRQGDTTAGVSKMFEVSSETILWANGLKKNSALKEGDVLVILPVNGVEHTILKGETLQSIAKKYNANAQDISLYNGILDTEALNPGDNLIIPDGEINDSPTPATKKPTSAKNDSTKKSASSATSKAAAVVKSISNYFARPVNGVITQSRHDKYAVDIGAPTGTPIYAAASGTVDFVNGSGYGGGYGLYVIVSHSNGTQTLYAHMSKVAASRGSNVSKGQILGYVGSTGHSTGPHLHFEVRGGSNPLFGVKVGTKI